MTEHPSLIERLITRLCTWLLWASTTVIFLILVANTLLRYGTGSSLQWANEVPELLFPWLVMAGVVLAAQQGAHIATTFMMDALRPALRHTVAALGWALVAALYATLAVATFRMLDIVHDEKTPILQLPGSLTYGCVMGGMVLLALLALAEARRAWQARSHQPAALPEAEQAPLPSAHW